MLKLLTLAMLLTSVPVLGQVRVRDLTLLPPQDSVSHEFSRIATVRELADGRVLIVDSRDRALYIANLRSDSVHQIGRTGSGPSEYQAPSRLVAVGGDTTLLVDGGNRRWLLLVGSRIVDTFSPYDSVVARAGMALAGADLRGHVLATVVGGRERLAGDRQQNRLMVLRVDRNSAQVDTIIQLKGTESQVQTERSARSQSTSVLELALSVSEQPLLFPDGWIAFVRQRPYRVDWLAPEGQAIHGPDLTWNDPVVDAREMEIYRRRMERQIGRTIPAPITGILFADVVPPFPSNALQSLPNKHLLILRSQWSGSRGVEYDMVDRRGRIVGHVQLPSNIRIVGVSEEYIFTVAVDDDGIEMLRRHPWSW